MTFPRNHLAHLVATYRDGLLKDTLPFWLPRSIDEEHGGYLLIRDRDGSLMDTDKAMWHQGRFAWLLAELYRTVEPREEWLRWSRHGIDFIRTHGFDDDGRVFFHVTREGRPVRKRRYLFSETFAIAALAGYAAAARDADPDGAAQAAREAEALYALVERWLGRGEDPSSFSTTFEPELAPRYDPQTRPAKGLAVPMILIATAQIVRRIAFDPALWTDRITAYIAEIERDFMHPEHRVVMETVAPDGSIIDHMDWRTITPGHSIEASWFILQEAIERGNDKRLVKLGTTILDWMWDWGWDTEYGGILYFRDVTGRPVQEYWHDMKFWWPHCEAIIASLMAYRLTNEPRYARMHELVREWAYAHFPDPEHGEWFGYLHRDGSLSVPTKGNLWKGPFHLPRMQLVAWREAEQIRAAVKPV